MSRRHAVGAGLASVTVTAALALAGCSASITGSAHGQVALQPESAPTTVVDDSVAAATTVAATTAAPTTTVAPTTAAPTTAAPTTAVATTAVPTTVPSPAIIPVAAPPAPFESVGGNSGSETARIQQRLFELGFWLNSVDGDYGLTTSQAVMAFQKYNGLETSGRVDDATAAALTNIPMRAHGKADAGTLIEVDKDMQLIFMVQNGVTVWVFNTSTGNGETYTEPDKNTPGESITGVSLTPSGLHAVNRERAEGWWEGDLGKIYRPKYFVGGVAVHGSNSVPNYPASHGCVRVTTTAMDYIWDTNLMPIGIPVWVHGTN